MRHFVSSSTEQSPSPSDHQYCARGHVPLPSGCRSSSWQLSPWLFHRRDEKETERTHPPACAITRKGREVSSAVTEPVPRSSSDREQPQEEGAPSILTHRLPPSGCCSLFSVLPGAAPWQQGGDQGRPWLPHPSLLQGPPHPHSSTCGAGPTESKLKEVFLLNQNRHGAEQRAGAKAAMARGHAGRMRPKAVGGRRGGETEAGVNPAELVGFPAALSAQGQGGDGQARGRGGAGAPTALPLPPDSPQRCPEPAAPAAS